MTAFISKKIKCNNEFQMEKIKNMKIKYNEFYWMQFLFNAVLWF